MRHIFTLPIAAAFMFGPVAFNSDKAKAMIGDLERFADTLSSIERAGCWRYGWHGWGWYPWCGWEGYNGGGWGWHRGWGWHHGWQSWLAIMAGIMVGAVGEPSAALASGPILSGTQAPFALLEIFPPRHTCVKLFTPTRNDSDHACRAWQSC
jgi:hypothetical protein